MSATLRASAVRLPLLAATIALAAPSAIRAQGTVSTQGFGYPVSGLSVRAVGTAGAFGEFDAISPLNPGSIGGVTRIVLSAQTEPEYRTLSLGGVREKNTIQRIPLLMLVMPLPKKFSASLSGSTLLDRTFATTTVGQAVLGDQTLPTTDSIVVHGAISNIRGALGYQVNDRLLVGVATHLFTGSNEVALTRRFEDPTRFGAVADTSTVTYLGTGVSFGADARINKQMAVSASYRIGFDMNSHVGKREISTGKVPSRLGASVRYEGIPGSVFAAGIEQVNWSSMRSLGTSAVEAHDALNFSIGGETAGPSIRDYPVQLRAGYARVQLPFGVNGGTGSEQRISGGVGLPINRDFATLDLSLQRAIRTMSGTSAKEGAWLVGFGVQIRPQF